MARIDKTRHERHWPHALADDCRMREPGGDFASHATAERLGWRGPKKAFGTSAGIHDLIQLLKERRIRRAARGAGLRVWNVSPRYGPRYYRFTPFANGYNVGEYHPQTKNCRLFLQNGTQRRIWSARVKSISVAIEIISQQGTKTRPQLVK
jgi:hypothetical protein